jgi:diguanylate cyclase (GGDEF)-like protein
MLPMLMRPPGRFGGVVCHVLQVAGRPTLARTAPATCRPARSKHFRPVHPGRDQTLGKEARRDRAARRAPLRVVGIAAATAAVVALAGEAFWVCVPAALLAAATSRGRRGGAIGAGLVVVAAAGAALTRAGNHPLPPALLTVIVPAVSIAILLSVRARLEDERDALRASAFTDPLTGVANRRSLLERIDYEISRHARSRHSFTLLMLDLDGFKALNDRFGHPAGDDLLCDVAGALSRVIRDQDTLARVGGDEFCVLAPETDSAGAERLTSRVESAVARVVAGVDALGAGVGAAVFPHDGRTADTLLEAADQRLLEAKRHARRDRPRRRAA